MTNRAPEPAALTSEPRFYSVAQVAQIFGTSRMTIYRAIREGELSVVRIRGRLLVPSRALDAMVEAACAKTPAHPTAAAEVGR